MKIRVFESLLTQGGGEAIKKLFSCKSGDDGVSAVLVLRLSYFQAKLQEIFKAYVKAKEELVLRFAEKDEQGVVKTTDKNNIVISPSKIEEFSRAFDAFLETDIEEALGLEEGKAFNRLSVSFDDMKSAIKGNQLSPNDITPCLPFINIIGFEYSEAI